MYRDEQEALRARIRALEAELSARGAERDAALARLKAYRARAAERARVTTPPRPWWSKPWIAVATSTALAVGLVCFASPVRPVHGIRAVRAVRAAPVATAGSASEEPCGCTGIAVFVTQGEAAIRINGHLRAALGPDAAMLYTEGGELALVEVTKPGYKRVVKRVRVPDCGFRHVNITLKPDIPSPQGDDADSASTL